MTIRLTTEALDTLYDIADFIDSINTPGAGQFWVNDFIVNLHSYAKPHVSYSFCSNKTLAEENLSVYFSTLFEIPSPNF